MSHIGIFTSADYSQPKASDSNGNRTRVTAVKGRCLNRLTMEPGSFYKYTSTVKKNSPSRTRTYDSAVNSRVLYRLSYRGILADTQLPVKPIINKLYLQNFTQNPSIKPTNIIRYIWSSPRSISNSQLHTLPCFHLCPIYLVVFKGSYSLM